MSTPKKKKRSNLTEEEQHSGRRGLMILLGAVAAISVFIVVCGIVFAITNAVESANVVDLYGEELASACQPTPAGAASLENLSQAETPRGVLLLISDSQRRHAWQSALPAPWQGESADTVSLVGCVAEDRIDIETCEYQRQAERGGDTFTVRIRRQQHTVTVTLVNPTLGTVIDQRTLDGPEPAPCPPDSEVTNSGNERGADVEWADFAPWIEGYVMNDGAGTNK